MSTANLDSADLKSALAAPGLIREEVMNQLWDISQDSAAVYGQHFQRHDQQQLHRVGD